MTRLQPFDSPAAQAALAQIRLIATDMDGTLTHNEQFRPALLTMLEKLKAAKIPVIITTGRSAGWVSAVVHYLPVVGAMAENGGVYLSKTKPRPTFAQTDLDVPSHRQALREQFERLRQQYPQLTEAADNGFRLTDWTYDVSGLSPTDLQWMSENCQANGFSFTYSTVQCHIKPGQQNKANGLMATLPKHFPELLPQQVLTVGDSPNDESLFAPHPFPTSVGVANVKNYLTQLAYHPAFITQAAEGDGFCEVAQLLLNR